MKHPHLKHRFFSINMTKAHFLNFLIPAVDPLFLIKGYHRRSNCKWIKKIQGIRFEINIGFWKTGEECNTYLSFGVRYNKVQDIVNQYHDMNPKEYKNTDTLLMYLTHMNMENVNSYSFYTERDLQKIITEEYAPFISEKLGEITDRYSDLENILDLYINPQIEYHQSTKRIYTDKVTAVVIAKFLRKSNYNEIAANVRDEFEKLKVRWPESTEVYLYDKYFDKMLIDLEKM